MYTVFIADPAAPVSDEMVSAACPGAVVFSQGIGAATGAGDDSGKRPPSVRYASTALCPGDVMLDVMLDVDETCGALACLRTYRCELLGVFHGQRNFHGVVSSLAALARHCGWGHIAGRSSTAYR